jgi:hypothetical protein
MQKEEFRQALAEHFGDFEKALASESGDWTVKGFIGNTAKVTMSRPE